MAPFKYETISTYTVNNNKGLITITGAGQDISAGNTWRDWFQVSMRRTHIEYMQVPIVVTVQAPRRNPFFVEKGRIIGQRVLSVMLQPQLEFTFIANGTINNSINFTNTGTTVSNLGQWNIHK